jgi:hypothetical protein
MDLKEIGWEGVGCIHLAQDRNHWWAAVLDLRNGTHDGQNINITIAYSINMKNNALTSNQ